MGLVTHSTWDLPGPGIEPLFPSLAGGFLATAPPGKLLYSLFKWTMVLFFFHSELSGFFISAFTRHIWHQRLVSWKTVFPWTRAWEWFQNNSNVLHLLCTFFLLLLHQPHLTSSGVRSQNLGLPALYILVSNPFFWTYCR